MHYLIALLITAILSLSPAQGASINRSGPTVVAPLVIMAAKPKPPKKSPKQPYMIIKLENVMVTSY